jgi:hypothetical protein
MAARFAPARLHCVYVAADSHDLPCFVSCVRRDLQEGTGMMTYGDGSMYQGSWHDDKVLSLTKILLPRVALSLTQSRCVYSGKGTAS